MYSNIIVVSDEGYLIYALARCCETHIPWSSQLARVHIQLAKARAVERGALSDFPECKRLSEGNQKEPC